MDVMAERCKLLKPDVIAGIEARGFIFAPQSLTNSVWASWPIRKPGKLPHKVHKLEYDLEYGKDSIEIHSGRRVPWASSRVDRRSVGNRRTLPSPDENSLECSEPT